MTHDAIVVGAGHNGLTCACYLARAGLNVLVLEQYRDYGGMTISEEVTAPGYLSDVHASGYLVAKLAPAVAELELAEHGLELITPDPNWALVTTDGQTLKIGRDVEDTVRQLERFSMRDAATWRSLYERYQAAKPAIVNGMYSAPQTQAAHLAQLNQSAEGTDEFRFEMQTARSWVNETFENQTVRAFLASFAFHAAASPDDVGGGEFAWLFSSVVQDVGVSIVKGGMHNVSAALAADLEAHGGQIKTGASVQKIVVAGERATGVRLEGGEEIAADRVVASNIDPYHLVTDLLGEEAVGRAIADKIRRYEWGDSFFTIHAALSEPVTLAAGDVADDELGRAGYIHVQPPGIEDLSEIFAQCRAGVLPETPLVGVVNEAVVDPTRAPAGKGLIKFVVHYVPYRLADGRTWDQADEGYADHVVDWLDGTALPGLRKRIIGRVVHSPVNLERRIASSVHGTHQHGAFVPYQHGAMRPIPEMGQFRAPVRNVYLCGAGSHPGSGVSMGPGHNAAKAICDDLGLPFPDSSSG
ncbi:MAG: NAD(P)/FAD-dependent oxidoreductase [Chloroflexi bacterium]|nr:NAD(P)/FAD-dependent oxidoreductase [Chloroflexota bacterium]